MIDNNILKFGYGDISVGAFGLPPAITFQQFKPPAKVGSEVGEHVEFIGEKIVIKLNHEDYVELCDLLDQVKNKEILIFDFKDYIFDFTNYNIGSIEVVERHATNSMHWYFATLAC